LQAGDGKVGDLIDLAIAQDMGDSRHNPDQFLQGPRSAHDTPGFEPVAEEHNNNQGGQFPEKVLSPDKESGGARIEKSNGDSSGDQGHHAGQFLLELR